MKLTRRYRFSASHRLQTPALSAEENRLLYGKCNNPYGHGHDYILDVTLEGARDASGQVANRAELDALVAGRVLARLDHKNLNTDVAELADAVPTTENLASAIRGAHQPLEAALELEARNLVPVMHSESTRLGVGSFLAGKRFWFT